MNNEEWNKMWQHDITTLSNFEVQKLLKNIMWQFFLVDVYSVKVNTHFYESGGEVEIKIVGEPFRDPDNIPITELLEKASYSEEDFDDEDFEEEDGE